MDGTKVVSGACDDTVRIWDPATGECEKVLERKRGSSFPPKNFDTAPGNNGSKDLSQCARPGEPVGIESKEVYVFGERASAVIGFSIDFFRLIDG